MVEWKKICNLGDYFGGLTGKSKKDFENGNAKFITYMNVFSNPSLDVNTVGMVHINEGERQNKIQKGDVLFSGSSETPDEAGMSCVVTEELDGDYYMNSFCFGLRLNNPEQYNLHYLKHVFRSYNIRQAITKTASGVTRFNISKTRFGRVEIPIPSLSEQNRIVGILDTFTDSIENLKQQIAQRRKQYEFYRDQLLIFDFKINWYELIELCDYVDYRGKTPSKVDHGVFLVTAKNIRKGYIDYENSKEYIPFEDYEIVMRRGKPKKGDVLITTEAPCGNVAQVDDDSIALAQRVIKYRPKDERLNSGYLKYVLLGTDFQMRLDKEATGATAKGIKGSKLHKLQIPLPSLSEQQRIVSILDTFESSISNLEAQLAQRQKQYEYYRNKLLTFE